MKEQNRDSLRRALNRLPQYDPPPQSWAEIEAGLQAPPTAGDELGKVLPEYSPPAAVWNRINEQLAEAEPAARRTGIRRRRLPLGVWRIAAAVALFIGSFAVVQALNRGPEISYSYRKETNFQPTTVADWRQEEPQFQELATEIADYDHPAVNRLRSELEELTSARGDIETMLESYGDDPQLVRQLSEIERERSEVYRQLIVYR